MALLQVRQARAKKRKREIMGTAIEVFAELGLHRARIADVAKASGVAPSSIYDYFQNKEDLLYALPELQFGEFFVQLEQRLAPISDPRERLAEACRCNLDFIVANQSWARVLFFEVWPSVWVRDQRIGRHIDRFGRVFVDLIRDGIKAGAIDPATDPYVAANIVIGGMIETACTWLIYGKPADLAAARDPLVEHLMRVAPPPAEKGSEA